MSLHGLSVEVESWTLQLVFSYPTSKLLATTSTAGAGGELNALGEVRRPL
jgi:hypothetical protein